MKISRIDLWHVKVPLRAPFHPSWIPGFIQTENRFTLVRIATKDGAEGWSAAPAMGQERQGLGAMLGPYFLGERADDIAGVRQRIREMGYLGWRCGWLEPACWDLVARARGVPVWQLLGGRGGRVQLYASTGEVRTGQARIDEVLARMEEGFVGVKLRVHADSLAEDVEQLRTTRAGVGDDVVLGVDANQGWRVAVVADAPRWDMARAEAFCKAAADEGFSWVEEPLAFDAYDDLARLRANTTVDLTGGELNNHGLPEFGVMIERGCYDVYQPDAVFTGGIAETLAIARRAEAAGYKYTPHTWTNGIGFGINLQLYAASKTRDVKLLEYPFDPPGWLPEGRDGVLKEPWHHDRGWLDVPTSPGLGFEIDSAALGRFGKRFFTATPVRVAISGVLDKGLGVARALGALRDERLANRSQALDDAGVDPVVAGLGELGIAPPEATDPSDDATAPPGQSSD